jgi:hypothetical protein
MMRRLTERLAEFAGTLDGIAFINPHDRQGVYNLKEIVDWSEDFYLYKIANRLAAYEDTGLTPEEVKELAKAEVERLRGELAQYKRAYAEICHQFNFGDESEYKAMHDCWLDWAGKEGER